MAFGTNSVLRRVGQIQRDKAASQKDTGLTAEASTYKESPYKAQAYNNPNAAAMDTALNRRFDVLRQKQEGESNRQAQAAQEGLTRSAASRGRLGSGAFQRLQSLQQRDLAQQKEGAIGNIESQRELSLAEQQQKEADRKFAYEQEAMGREFQSGEAAKQRSFASEEARLQRANEINMYNRDSAFREKQFSESKKQFRQQMDMAIEQMAMDKDVTEFNKSMANKKKGKKYYEKVWEAYRDIHLPTEQGRKIGGSKVNKPLDEKLGIKYKKPF